MTRCFSRTLTTCNEYRQVLEDLRSFVQLRETLAYLEGIVDGDGYFKVSRSYRTPGTVHPDYATIAGVSQVWPGEAVKIFSFTFGGVVMDPRKISAGRLMARCEIRGAKAESAARRLLPFLLLKRDQAILLLEVSRLRSDRHGRVRDKGAACTQLEGSDKRCGGPTAGQVGPRTCFRCSPT
jgi:hypothetical protein